MVSDTRQPVKAEDMVSHDTVRRHERTVRPEPVVADDELSRTIAELTAARARVALIKRGAPVAPPSRWIRHRRRIMRWAQARVTPLGRVAFFAGRALHIGATEGPKGLAAAVGREMRARLGRPVGRSPIVAFLPEPLPPLAVPPMTDAAGVSIVIPVLNHAGLTYRCLRSVVEQTPAGAYEIVVVDNGSSDDTQRLLAHVHGLRPIRNDTNAGFGRACNQGAAVARGSAVLFLNNDTVVRPGWLGAMVETLSGDPSVGAVGAQLVFPNGQLQEAGGIIWSDGSGWNYGHGDPDPQRSEYQYRREVDYCSGACLLVRRELFAEVGGFDARYAPAFYEDVDLCFELRRLGRRVVYQPRAQVIHVGGATAGTDVRVGYKRFQENNRGRFADKHAGALAAQHPPDPARVYLARDRGAGRRVLVIDHHVPMPDQDAGSVRMQAMLELLVELGHKVTFVPDNLARIEPYTSALQQRGVEVLYRPHSIPEYLERHLEHLDLIVLCRATIAIKHMAALVEQSRRPPIVFDTIDLHYLRAERRAELTGDPALTREAARMRAAELYLATASDMVWVVSPHEVEVLRREDPDLSVEVLSLIHDVREAVPPAAARRDLLFVGGFRHPPNVDAVLYLTEEILPRVLRELPGVRLRIVGSHAPPEILRLASTHVEILGQVADLESLLDASRVFVAPIRYGAGIKGKITQSLANGLPVVTTPAGAEGIGLEHRCHALIAEDAADFAACVVELYRDAELWAHISEHGRRHVAERFGRDPAKRRLAAIIDRLLAGAGKGTLR